MLFADPEILATAVVEGKYKGYIGSIDEESLKQRIKEEAYASLAPYIKGFVDNINAAWDEVITLQDKVTQIPTQISATCASIPIIAANPFTVNTVTAILQTVLAQVMELIATINLITSKIKQVMHLVNMLFGKSEEMDTSKVPADTNFDTVLEESYESSQTTKEEAEQQQEQANAELEKVQESADEAQQTADSISEEDIENSSSMAEELEGLTQGNFEERISALETSTTELRDLIEHFASVENSHYQELLEKINNISTGGGSGDVSQIQTAVEELTTKVEALENSYNTILSRITPLETEIDNQGRQITSIQNAITSINNDIYAINGTITNVQSMVTVLREDVDDINSSISGLQLNIADLNRDLRTLESNLTSQINSLSDNVGNSFNIINQTLRSIQERLTALEGN